jgi:peptidoglycan/xylan/chitin deacetylase (PgdA/CDA1 family)
MTGQFTSELLDVLKKNNARATFFATAANGGKGQIQDQAAGFRDTIKRMHNDEHQIGSHSWSHEDFPAISAQQRRDQIVQIVKSEIALSDILGFFPTHMRIPFSS